MAIVIGTPGPDRLVGDTDPANLAMKLWVNGELRQSANTKDLVLWSLLRPVATARVTSRVVAATLISTPACIGGPVRCSRC